MPQRYLGQSQVGSAICYAVSTTDVAYGAALSATCLRACYAMSGADVAYGIAVAASGLRDARLSAYAMPGTESAAICLGATYAMSAVRCYAMSGTA
eukprot:107794-Rhodomonas_salina.2